METEEEREKEKKKERERERKREREGQRETNHPKRLLLFADVQLHIRPFIRW